MLEFIIRKKMMVIVLLLTIFSLQSLTSITTKSATFDEVQYFGVGKYLLTQHKWDVMGAILHPPLSYYLNSLPLLLVEEDKKVWNYDVKVRDLEFLGAIDYFRGQELLSSRFNNDDRLLIACRCMTLLLSVLLGVYIYRFSALLFGVPAGLLSLFYFSFCPNMLAFSGLCVPDMPLTVFSLIAVYYLWRSLHENDWKQYIYAGISFGLALLCKFPALLLIPLTVSVTVYEMIRSKRNLLPCMMTIGAVAFLVMLLGYQGDLTPFIQGYQYRLAQQGYGQSVYLFGQYSNHGWWYFYPLTILLKTPLPLLLCLPVSIFYLYRDKINYDSKLLFLLGPILLYLVVFSFSGYSVALRYLLPIYPFIFVLCGVMSTRCSKYCYSLIAVALWYIVSSITVAPHYLAYFNEACGGPGHGYKYLADSNLDWGQDLKGLKKFMEKNGVEKISLSYFGADNPRRYGINYDWLPSHYLFNPEPDKQYDIYPDQLVAVSVTNLMGVYLENRDMFKPLLEHEPIAKIGYSIYLYDLSGKGTFRK